MACNVKKKVKVSSVDLKKPENLRWRGFIWWDFQDFALLTQTFKKRECWTVNTQPTLHHPGFVLLNPLLLLRKVMLSMYAILLSAKNTFCYSSVVSLQRWVDLECNNNKKDEYIFILCMSRMWENVKDKCSGDKQLPKGPKGRTKTRFLWGGYNSIVAFYYVLQYSLDTAAAAGKQIDVKHALLGSRFSPNIRFAAPQSI